MQNKPYVSIAGVHATVSMDNRGKKTVLVINPASLSTLHDLYVSMRWIGVNE